MQEKKINNYLKKMLWKKLKGKDDFQKYPGFDRNRLISLKNKK